MNNFIKKIWIFLLTFFTLHGIAWALDSPHPGLSDFFTPPQNTAVEEPLPLVTDNLFEASDANTNEPNLRYRWDRSRWRWDRPRWRWDRPRWRWDRPRWRWDRPRWRWDRPRWNRGERPRWRRGGEEREDHRRGEREEHRR